MTVTTNAPAVKMTAAECAALDARADAAGRAAAEACVPTPMVVGTPRDMLGSLMGGDGGGFREDEPTYFVSGGICGTAYVLIRPGTSPMARFVKKHRGGWKGHYGGTQFTVRGYGQSFERSMAYAQAYAGVLYDAGIKAYTDSWVN
jgi:hypothetical protein